MSDWFPVINTFLLLTLMAIMAWRFRHDDSTDQIWDEIRALQFRLSVQEKTSPCPHCREHHLKASTPDNHDDC